MPQRQLGLLGQPTLGGSLADVLGVRLAHERPRRRIHVEEATRHTKEAASKGRHRENVGKWETSEEAVLQPVQNGGGATQLFGRGCESKREETCSGNRLGHHSGREVCVRAKSIVLRPRGREGGGGREENEHLGPGQPQVHPHRRLPQLEVVSELGVEHARDTSGRHREKVSQVQPGKRTPETELPWINRDRVFGRGRSNTRSR